MIRTDFRLAAVTALALGLSGTAALARSASYVSVAPVAAPVDADDAFVSAPFGAVAPAGAAVVAAPAVVLARPVAAVATSYVTPNVMGQFTCTFNERHTRLERQACGANSYRYGRVAD